MRRNDITKKILNILYNEKLLSKKEIAFRLYCNITTIHKKMIKFGIIPRKQRDAVKIAMKKKIIHIPDKTLRKLYLKNKLSIKDIAKKLQYSKETIKREMIREKIPFRTLLESIKLRNSGVRIKKSVLTTLYYKNKLTQKQIAKKLNTHHIYVSKLMKDYGLKTRSADFYHTKYKKHNFSNDLNEKAYLVGFKLGDLYAKLLPSKKLISVGTTSTKIEQIHLFKKLFKKYGNVWISKVRNDGNRVFTVILNRSFNFLLLKKDFVPKWISKNKKQFLSFLAGYTDAEGAISIAKNNVASFTLASYDKNILWYIYKGLLKIGIVCKPPKIRVKKGHRKNDGIIYRQNYWYIYISKKASLLKLLILLKPLLKHSKRLRDLKKAEKNITKRNNKIYITLPGKISLKYLEV